MNFNFELWLRCFLSVYHLSFFLLYMLHIISPINENSNFFFAFSCVCHNKGIFVYTNSKFIPEVTYFNQSLSKILYFRFFEIFLCIYMNLFQQCSVILKDTSKSSSKYIDAHPAFKYKYNWHFPCSYQLLFSTWPIYKSRLSDCASNLIVLKMSSFPLHQFLWQIQIKTAKNVIVFLQNKLTFRSFHANDISYKS